MALTQLAPQPTLTFDHRTERVVFLGTPAIAVPTLRALADTPLRPLAVITEPDRPVGRTLVMTPSPVKLAAQEFGIPVSQPATAAELIQLIESLRPTLGVVIAYGHILKPELIAVPDHGFVNFHFSLLPNYRGATPIQAALLAGDDKTGVTLMQIDPGLDTGPIIGYATEAIERTDTTGVLADRLAELAGTLATALIPDYLSGVAVGAPQPASNGETTKKYTKADGRIDWTASVEMIERFIRAMDPWPRAWTDSAGRRLIIHAAHTDADRLVLDRVQVAGHRVISGAEFARGYPAALTALVATGRVGLHF